MAPGASRPPMAAPASGRDAIVGSDACRAELTDQDMPPLASLTADSDYSGSLSSKVSEALRRAACKAVSQHLDSMSSMEWTTTPRTSRLSPRWRP